MKKFINKLICNNKNSVNIHQTDYTNIISDNNILTETKKLEQLQNILITLTNKIEKLENKIQEYKSKYEALQHIEQLASYYICNICLANPKNVLFMPCGHFVSCLDCMNSCCNSVLNSLTDTEYSSNDYLASRFKCPLCRITVEYYIDIYS